MLIYLSVMHSAASCHLTAGISLLNKFLSHINANKMLFILIYLHFGITISAARSFISFL